MFEVEIALSCLALGIVLDRWIIPKVILPKLRERLIHEEYKREKWPEHKPCSLCGSRTKHKADCPEHPKNKKANP